MLVTFPHEVRFTNENNLSVRDVASSLLANEQILQNVGRVLELCIDGLEVSRINVVFVSASINSPLKEALSAGILLTFQKDLEREIPKLVEKISGQQVDDHYKTLVTVIFLVIVIYGIEQAWQFFKKREDKEKDSNQLPSIHGNFNTVVHVGGNLIGVDPGKLADAVDKTFHAKRKLTLAKQALAFIRPAKLDKGSAIEGAGLVIEAETISAAPSDKDMEDQEENRAPDSLQGRVVVIHATDKDHAKTGWAGHIPGFWERRVPMKLVPGIEPSLIFGKEQITADVLVTYRVNAAGDDVPEAMHIYKVYD